MKWEVTYKSDKAGAKSLIFYSDNFTTAAIDSFNVMRLQDPMDSRLPSYIQRVIKLEQL